jgi:hypothetical protein
MCKLVLGLLIKMCQLISGRVTYSAGQTLVFTVNNLSDGFYFISLINENKQVSKKLLVNH